MAGEAMAGTAISFDANVLFYAVDGRDADKQVRAASILRRAAAGRLGFLTLQALGEFSFAAVRKGLLSRREAAQSARDWATIFETRFASHEAFDRALDWWADERTSYWDALLIATVSTAGAAALVSEDLQDGAIIGGVEIIDPFGARATERLAVFGLETDEE